MNPLLIALLVILVSAVVTAGMAMIIRPQHSQRPSPQDESTWKDTGLPKPYDPDNPRSKA